MSEIWDKHSYPKVLLKSLINTNVKCHIHCHAVGRLRAHLWAMAVKATSLHKHSLPSLPERHESPGDACHPSSAFEVLRTPNTAHKCLAKADFYPDVFSNLTSLPILDLQRGSLVSCYLLGSLAKMGRIHLYLGSNWCVVEGWLVSKVSSFSGGVSLMSISIRFNWWNSLFWWW